MPLTYARYLQLEKLLDAQQPLSSDPEHDEMLFIITHQVFELWFKQLLHELKELQRAFEANQTSDIFRCLKRSLSILKVMVAQMDIIETMSPISFNSFRQRLESASGFQSAQFREVEFLLGQRNPKVFAHYPEGIPERTRLENAMQQPSLWDAFLSFMQGNGYEVPEEVKQRDLTQPTHPNHRVQQQLIKMYQENPLLSQICELLIDFDEGLQEWRYRHVKMVERTIGTKAGTGGSPGADYLVTTLLKPVFPDLWEIRKSL